MKANEAAVSNRSCWGCGELVRDTPAGRGRWKRYCSDECRDTTQAQRTGTVIRSLRPGERVPETAPRRYRSGHGYIRLRWPVRPGLVLETYEHRVRDGAVVDDEHVHHINHHPDDNRPENLRGMTAQEHADVHHADKRAPWQAIAKLYENGQTQPEIATALGISSSTVSRSLRRLGVSVRTPRERRPLPSEQDTRSAYAGSDSSADLARRLGVSLHVARAAMKAYGLPSFAPGRRMR